MTGAELERRWCKFDWTDERIEELKQLWGKGLSAAAIARAMGCRSRSAILGKVHRLKLPKRDGTDRESTRVLSKMHAKRRQRRSVAVAVGIGRGGHIAPPAAKRVVPLPPAPKDVKPAHTVTLEALEAKHCRWPYRENGKTTFCGCEVIVGSSWCGQHFRRVYKPVEIQVRRVDLSRQPTFYDRERENA